ncbi:MAG: ABC transporter permease [Armatimonadota bacterium]
MTGKTGILAPAGLIVLLVALWWGAVAAGGSVIIPTPGQVILGIGELARQGVLFQHVMASLFRVSVGYLLAVALAIPLGLVMGRVGSIYAAVNPVIQILRPISPIAWIPLAILWFGVGDVSPVFLIFLSSFFPMVVYATAGVHTIDRQYMRASQNFGVSGFKLLRLVILPGALPQIIVGMRISIGVAWLVVVAAEMIALSAGLGFLIMDSRNAGNRYDLVVAGMVMIGVIGLMLDTLMRRLERLKMVQWRYGR